MLKRPQRQTRARKNRILNTTFELEKRFYILISVIILSLILGLFILLTKSPGLVKEKSGGQSISSLLKAKKTVLGRKGIVILPVNGIIQFGITRNILGAGNYGAEYLIRKIEQYAKEKNVKGMVLRINSPGGTIGAVQELYNAILNFRKQNKFVIASMADIAASGGYYIAAACDKIVANPGTITGSIGVIIYSPSFKGLFQKVGISYNIFKSGKHKYILASYRDVTPEEKKILQSVVDDAYKQFYNDVRISRNIPEDKLKTYADGRIFTGSQAKKIKLIDEVGGLKEAIKIAGVETGLGEEPQIIRDRITQFDWIFTIFNKKKTAADKLMELDSENNINIWYLYMP